MKLYEWDIIGDHGVALRYAGPFLLGLGFQLGRRTRFAVQLGYIRLFVGKLGF